MRSLFSLPVGAERSTKANQAHHSKVLMERRRGEGEGGGANGGEDKSTRGNFVGTRMEEGETKFAQRQFSLVLRRRRRRKAKTSAAYSAELISMAKRLSPKYVRREGREGEKGAWIYPSSSLLVLHSTL